MSRGTSRQPGDELRVDMLQAVTQFFEDRLHAATPEHQLQLATAALFIEMTRADFQIKPDEMEAVDRAVQRALELTPEETTEIVRLPAEEVKASAPLHEFTRLVDENFSMEKKKRVVKLLWQVAYSDAELQGHEEYLVRKIADRLHLAKADFLDAKIQARDDFR